MAVNVSVFDLDNFPNNPKTVTVDLSELVPFGNNGEDTWVLSAVTTATASGGAAIQRLYIKDTKWGWAASSGLKPGPYTVNDSKKHLKVAIDEAIGSAAEIALTTSNLTLGGDTVAADMQEKINALASSGGPKANNLSYKNAVVEYENGRFKIISGTASSVYTGANRSSVAVADGTSTTGLAAELGFNIPFTSETLAGTAVEQTSLSVGYSSGTSMTVTTAGIVNTGDAIAITDGVNKEYRGVVTAGGTAVILASGLANSYEAGSLVQVLDVRDPSGEIPPAYSSVDDYIKFAIASIVNQINFGG